jgi:hypothetical protein
MFPNKVTVLKGQEVIDFIHARQNKPEVIEVLSEQILKAAHEVSAELHVEIMGAPVMYSGKYKDTQKNVVIDGYHLMMRYWKKDDQGDSNGWRQRHWILEKIGERNFEQVHYLGATAPMPVEVDPLAAALGDAHV